MQLTGDLEEAIVALVDVKHILQRYYQQPEYTPSLNALQLFATIALHAHNALWISEAVHSDMQRRYRIMAISLES